MTTTDLAISHAQFARRTENPVKTILSCCWISLGLLYDELAGQKEIEPIGRLPIEQKKKLWKMTEGSKFKRIYQVRALYMWELINQPIGSGNGLQDATTAIPDGLEWPGIVGEG